jgi:two-component system nitrogen regulation sensor histidine kinase NtrY
MALRLRHPPAPAKTAATPARRSSAPQGRKPFFDNTPVLLAGILALILALAGLLALGSRSSALAPDFVADVVLYALSATNLTILVALTFVLARNIVKLVVERRKALPFARFRFKLVTVLLAAHWQRVDSQQRRSVVQRRSQ